MAHGEALLLDLQSEAAIAEFTKALEVDPTAIQALILRAKAWNRHFQYARAIDDYAEAIRRAAADPAPPHLPGSLPPAPPGLFATVPGPFRKAPWPAS